MGIVNATPDSFSDGGMYFSTEAGLSATLAYCEKLIRDGADLLDIGGESTRPGASPVPLAQELARVLPVVRHAVTLGVPVSVDTYKPEVMRAVLDLGADIINDIWALRQPGAMPAVAAHPRCGVCLMHMHREPQTMQVSPMEGDVVAQVLSFLEQATHALQASGVGKTRIVLDVGVGFGKTVAQNFALLARQREFLTTGYPLLAAWSRKSSLAAVCSPSSAAGEPLDMAARMVPSVAAALLSVERGARVVRVHDVRETVQALKVWTAAS
ncbi:MAG: Dihydropteroate synthase [Polaromonas sp.]|nr:Dihydropteroate synthase [Polaromonas sp.]